MVAKAGARGANRIKKYGQPTYPSDRPCPSCGINLLHCDWSRVVITCTGAVVHRGDCHSKLIAAGEAELRARATNLRERVDLGEFRVHPGALESVRLKEKEADGVPL